MTPERAPATPLWVTADDYGLDAAGDEATRRLADAGALTAVSVMVHDGATPDLGALSPTVARGLHLMFTRERPLVLDARSPLVDARTGRLPGSAWALFAQLHRRPALVEHLRAEAAAQLARFVALAGPPAFVNGHEHVHQHPLVWPLYVELLAAHPAARVRSAHPLPLSPRRPRAGLVTLAARLSWRRRPLARDLLVPLAIDDAEHLSPAAIAALVAAPPPLPAGTPELLLHPRRERSLVDPAVVALLRRHRLAAR